MKVISIHFRCTHFVWQLFTHRPHTWRDNKAEACLISMHTDMFLFFGVPSPFPSSPSTRQTTASQHNEWACIPRFAVVFIVLGHGEIRKEREMRFSFIRRLRHMRSIYTF